MKPLHHIDQAITELTRAKVAIETDPTFARYRLNDARLQIAGALAKLLAEASEQPAERVMEKSA